MAEASCRPSLCEPFPEAALGLGGTVYIVCFIQGQPCWQDLPEHSNNWFSNLPFDSL